MATAQGGGTGPGEELEQEEEEEDFCIARGSIAEGSDGATAGATMTFSAQKCGICFQPPSIILIYRDNSQDKTRQRIMPIRHFSRFSGEVLSFLSGSLQMLGEEPIGSSIVGNHCESCSSVQEGLCWGNISPRSPKLHLNLSNGSLSPEGLERPLGRVWKKMCVWEEVCCSCRGLCWLSPDCSRAAEQLKNNPRHKAYLEGVSLRQLQKLYSLLRGRLEGHSLAESLEKFRQEETIDPEEDMNKLDDKELAKRKSIMDELFEKNRKKKDDPDFVYNVEVEFPQDEQLESCTWDMESDEEI
ncbi:centrosomal protein of 19 kDa isoform X1 [Parus major]|uniref:centrosomal protein of 19 kDa isoform X1 n=1 Tax=Parus major TaxID=9157 RepID=UPI00077166E4|nr:centrosomal protein of 19 kDa isoform X1 [Parus major]